MENEIQASQNNPVHCMSSDSYSSWLVGLVSGIIVSLLTRDLGYFLTLYGNISRDFTTLTSARID